MRGNDIVDMATAALESNWKRKGFLEKIFTPQEQQYIKRAASPGEMVWKLWSMKEAAYKVYTRQFGGRFFAPLRSSCTITTESNDSVAIGNIIYQTRTTFTEDYIYSVAKPVAAKDSFIADHCFRIPVSAQTKQQEFIYKELIARYSELTGNKKNGLAIIKNEFGVPFLYCNKERSAIPISITHHGHYAAFTIN